MLLAELADASARVRAASARTAKVAILAECLRRMPPGEAAVGALLLAGELPSGPVGVGWANLAGAESPAPVARPSLTLTGLAGVLRTLAGTAGRGSSKARAAHLADLLGQATEGEQLFLRALLLRELRQGALAGLVVEAVAVAAGVSTGEVRRAMMVAGDLGVVAQNALAGGRAALRALEPTLFRPLQPMLAQSAASIPEALGRLGRAGFEAKVDGARIQVHRSGDRVAVYTRSLRDVTPWMPEVVRVAAALPVSSVILDGEAVALGPDGRPLAFQETMGRFGSTTAATRVSAEVPLTPLFFDLLHLDGEDLLDRGAEERASALSGVLEPLLLVPRLVTGDPGQADAFYRDCLRAGFEGIVAKDPEAPYEAGRRGTSWIKVKPVRSLDLVVLAAEWGSGRRRGWLSNLHLGARDPAGGFVMLGKTFKGLSDEMLEWQTGRLLEMEVAREGHVVIVRPELVVEVAFDGVQASSRYPGGVALRFARVKRYRLDKAAAAADTIEAVRAAGVRHDA